MVFVKGLTLRSGNFVFWDDELGYFNHSKNLFQDSISLFSEFVYNNDKDCVESVFKNGSDFSTHLLLVYDEMKKHPESSRHLKIHICQ